MLTIDGSSLEGGGQIVRTALSFSALTKEDVKMTNIRKGRKQPGLKTQHLAAVKALKKLCDAEVKGDLLGSEEIYFKPNKLKSCTINVNIETAGSITLLIQNILLPCLFAPGKTRLKITGGTDVMWSPSVDYLKYITLPSLKDYVKDINLEIIKRGYYPKGHGEVYLEIIPKYNIEAFDNFQEFKHSLKEKINLNYDYNVLEINGISHASNDLSKNNVAERQANAARASLFKLNIPIKIKIEYNETPSIGSGITLWVVTDKENLLGTDSLGEKGKRAELVGEEAALKLLKEINARAVIDKHMADHLIPFLAIFGGSIKTSEITNHCKTNIWVCEQFIKERFEIKDNIITLKE